MTDSLIPETPQPKQPSAFEKVSALFRQIAAGGSVATHLAWDHLRALHEEHKELLEKTSGSQSSDKAQGKK